MTTTQATTRIQEFIQTAGTNIQNMTASSGPGSQHHTKQDKNRLNDLHHQAMREHYTNQLVKKFGGDTRSRLKAKLNKSS